MPRGSSASCGAADVEVGVSLSDAGREVLATELHGDPELRVRPIVDRASSTDLEGVTVYGEADYSSPYASGSARVDGYVSARAPCRRSARRGGRHGEPDPPRRLRGAQGGPPARARPAGDAPVHHPSRGHAPASQRRRRDPPRVPGLLPCARSRSTTWSASSSRGSSTSSASTTRVSGAGANDGDRARYPLRHASRRTGCARCSTGSPRSTTS